MEPRGPFSVVGVPADTCWERCGMFSGLGDIVSAADHPHLSLSHSLRPDFILHLFFILCLFCSFEMKKRKKARDMYSRRMLPPQTTTQTCIIVLAGLTHSIIARVKILPLLQLLTEEILLVWKFAI